MMVEIFDTSPCFLGEGPLWHPLRQELFWFDIIGKTMLAKGAGETRKYHFDDNVSAAGWIDENRLLIASDCALVEFNLLNGQQSVVCALEDDNFATRSNDGRADPQGGFWIGTMGRNAEDEAGAIYRFYRGELRKIFGNISIPNAIAFAPDGRSATFADSRRQKILRVALHPDTGWPLGAPQVMIDLSDTDFVPDGAVFDSQGCLWNAQWGAARLARYDDDGNLLQTIELPTAHITCPAFGGDYIYVTSAREGLGSADLVEQPTAGMTFRCKAPVQGLAEHRVIMER